MQLKGPSLAEIQQRTVFKFLVCSNILLLKWLLCGLDNEVGTNTRSVTITWLEGTTSQMYTFSLFWLSAMLCSSICFTGFVTVWMGKVRSRRIRLFSKEKSPKKVNCRTTSSTLSFPLASIPTPWFQSILTKEGYILSSVLGFVMVGAGRCVSGEVSIQHRCHSWPVMWEGVRSVSTHVWCLYKQWDLGVFWFWFSFLYFGCYEDRRTLTALAMSWYPWKAAYETGHPAHCTCFNMKQLLMTWTMDTESFLLSCLP